MKYLSGFFLLMACLDSRSLICAADVAAALPKTQAKLAAHEPVTIVCLGDSVTGIYYHTGGRRAYPEMIAVGLKESDSRSENQGCQRRDQREYDDRRPETPRPGRPGSQTGSRHGDVRAERHGPRAEC